MTRCRALCAALAFLAAAVGAVVAAPGPTPHPDERWDSPALTRTRLVPVPLRTVQTDTRPLFTRQIVQVQWRALDPVYLYVIRPRGAAAKPPVMLALYGHPDDAQRFLNDGYCERLTRHGCAAVGFESALTGSRVRYRPLREWFVSEMPEALAESAHDVQYVIDYLAARGDLDTTRLGMFGQGSGGAIAILAAGADPRIKALDLLNPWGDWPSWVRETAAVPDDERARYLTPAFQKALRPLEPTAWLPRLKGRKLRIQSVQDEGDVPAVCRDKIAQAAPPGTPTLRYSDNVALFNATSNGRLFDWMGSQLNPAPVKSGAATSPVAQSVPAAH